MFLVQIKAISKSFISGTEKIHILQNLSINIESGSSVSILGHSGSGKSTFLNLLGGLDRADSGEIYCDGKDIAKMSERMLTQYRQRTIGFIFQNHYTLKDLTALENVLLPARIARLPIAMMRKRAEILLETVGLSARSHHLPHMLSGENARELQ